MIFKHQNKVSVKNILSKPRKRIGLKFILSTQLRKFNFIPINRIPISWSDIYFKTYPRFQKIILKYLHNRKDVLFNSLSKRESNRDFRGRTISFQEANQVLYYSCGIHNIKQAKRDFNKSRRMYPSAGAKYPLEIYPVIFRVTDIPKGIYHFNVKDNDLELLLQGDFKEIFEKITGQDWVKDSSILIIITAIFKRTTRKYKERGWRYILFEAGHIAQNIYLIATHLGIKTCAIGGFLDNEIIHILDLDPNKELPIYIIAVGK